MSPVCTQCGLTNAEADERSAVLVGIGVRIILPLWLAPHSLPWDAPTGLEQPWDRWGITLSWVAGLVLGVWYVLRFKRVRLDGDTLLISNYVREVRVPLRSVRSTGIDTLGRSRWAVIDFDSETPFGTSISFMPKTLETAKGVEYPIVAYRVYRDTGRVSRAAINSRRAVSRPTPPAPRAPVNAVRLSPLEGDPDCVRWTRRRVT